MDAADPGWRQLGAVLLEAGLVGEHDLADALAEQERSGRLLGEILIRRGLVSAPAVANALAEQHGGLLKTEHGFGTGLGAITAYTSVSGSAPTPPEAPPVSLPRAPEHVLEDTEPAGLSEEPLRSAASSGAVPPAGALQAASPEQQDEGSLQTPRQPPPDLGYLLFVPTSQGYLLLQRSGTAPPVGEILELPESPGARLIVGKLAVSPLPQDSRVCAYLNNH